MTRRSLLCGALASAAGLAARSVLAQQRPPFDMHGNVVEWCRDWFHAKLAGGKDPDLSSVRGTMNRDGTYSRSRRGSAWTDDGWASRSAFRQRFEPERRYDHIGFRVAAVQL
jgi:sulfatase modifying factor 1